MSDTSKNWYTAPVAIRFPAAQARCQELMTAAEWEELFRVYKAGALLEAMENWLKEYDENSRL